MSFYTILLVAGALGTDAFSLAVGMGLGQRNRGGLYLFPLVVAVFHVLMPLIGLWAGNLLGQFLGQVAAFIGGAVLVLLGLNMIRESREQKYSARVSVPGSGAGGIRVFTGAGAMILVAGSVSLDALTAGLGLGTIQANLSLTVLTFGLVAGLMTLAGLVFGQRLGYWLGEKAQLLGGLILALIGLAMFFKGKAW